MYKYFLGIRYLLGRPINLLGTFGVMVAVWALVVIISVFSGFIHEVRFLIRGAAPALTLLDDSLETSFAEVEKRLLADPAVAAVAPRIKWHALIYPQKSRLRGQFLRVGDRDTRSTPFLQVIGIDIAKERSVSPIDAWIRAVEDETRRVSRPEAPFAIDAERLPPDRKSELGQEPQGVLLGDERTRWTHAQVATQVGDEVILASARRLPTGGVQSVKKKLVMSGAFRSDKHHEIEATQAFVDIELLRSIHGHDIDDPRSRDITTEVSIALHDEAAAEEVAARLNRELRENGLPGAVVTWEQRKARFLRAVEYERGVMKVVLFVFMVVASFLIFATLSMMVTKKTRDIGIVSALGGTRRGILTIFMISGSVIALLGTLLGLVTGYLSCLHLNDFNQWLEQTFGRGLFPRTIYGLREIPYELDSRWLVQVAVLAILNAAVFSFLPALRAARFDPVRALRYE